MLQHAVEKAMSEAGFRDSVSPQFHPHITLLYGDHDLPEQPVEPISWIARELVLVHSLHGQTMYQPKGRWLLRDGAPVEPLNDYGVGYESDRPTNLKKKSTDNDE